MYSNIIPYEERLETILGACKTSLLEGLVTKQGISVQNVAELLHAVRHKLRMAPRSEMEKDLDTLHFIPYAKVSRKGGREFLVYNRPTKNNGEMLLAGKNSCGFAGHVDFIDFLSYMHRNADGQLVNKGGVDAYATCINSFMREMGEELFFTLSNITGSAKYNLTELIASGKARYDIKGFIIDGTDKVGQTHLGIYIDIEVDSDLDVGTTDKDVINPHWTSLADCRENMRAEVYNFENWSAFIIDHMDDTTTHLPKLNIVDLDPAETAFDLTPYFQCPVGVPVVMTRSFPVPEPMKNITSLTVCGVIHNDGLVEFEIDTKITDIEFESDFSLHRATVNSGSVAFNFTSSSSSLFITSAPEGVATVLFMAVEGV